MSAPNDVHPHDLALLYDFVDGRLAPRAADELVRRLAEEPALRTVHAGILALRRRLAALPTPPLPSDFLERVRARAGFPAAPAASAASATTASLPSPGSAATDRADVRPAAAPAPEAGAEPRQAGTELRDGWGAGPHPAARLLSFARFAYAAAALVVVALGVFVYMSDRAALEKPSTQTVAEGVGYATRGRDELADKTLAGRGDDAQPADRARGAVPSAAAGAGSAPAEAGVSRGAPGGPRPFGPNGAIAPGVRTPADDDGAKARATDARKTPFERDGDGSEANEADKRKRGELAGADHGAYGGGGGAGGGTGGRAPRGGGALARKPGSPVPESEPASVAASLPAGAFEGADRVLVVYSDSYDLARAEVALLVDDARASRALDATRLGGARRRLGAMSQGEAVARTKREADAAGATRPATPSAPPPDDAPPASTPAPTDAPSGSGAANAAPLGTFFVELDDASLARLSGALGTRAAVDEATLAKDQEDEKTGARESAGADSPTEESPASPPAAPLPAPVPAPAPSPAPPPAPTTALPPTSPSTPVAPPPPSTPADGPKPDAGLTGTPTSGEPDPAMSGDGARGGAAGERPARPPGAELRHVRIVVLPRR